MEKNKQWYSKFFNKYTKDFNNVCQSKQELCLQNYKYSFSLFIQANH